MTAPPLGQWSIRPALPGDAVRYAAAADRFFRQTYGHDADHAAVMDRHCAETFDPAVIRAQLSDPNVTVLLVEDGAAILGIAQVQVRGAIGEVQRLYVDETLHGAGVAQTLMAMLADIASDAKVDALELGVWARNERAISFYGRQGFLPTGTVDFVLAGAAQSDVLMRRPLPFAASG